MGGDEPENLHEHILSKAATNGARMGYVLCIGCIWQRTKAAH
jgi:hypothetical protein